MKSKFYSPRKIYMLFVMKVAGNRPALLTKSVFGLHGRLTKFMTVMPRTIVKGLFDLLFRDIKPIQPFYDLPLVWIVSKAHDAYCVSACPPCICITPNFDWILREVFLATRVPLHACCSSVVSKNLF